MSWLIVDTETTGLDPKRHSILEIGALFCDDDFNQISEFSSLVLPIGEIEPEAMAINKIDIRQIKYNRQSVWSIFSSWLETNDLRTVIKPNLVGHNLQFDAPFINQLFDDRWTGGIKFSDVVGREFIDTKAIATFYRLIGKLPAGCSTSLDKLIANLESCKKYTAHRALDDCYRTLELLKFLRTL